MRFGRVSYVLLACLFLIQSSPGQLNRIRYNNQDLFLSGANLAWVSFAHDIGPGITDTLSFIDVFDQMNQNGGNALRFWLHINGTSTPEFDGSNYVIGPGAGTIDDLKKILDLAWEREIGMVLCLWSFDMQRSSGSGAIGAAELNRNRLLLTDTNYTRAYIDNCLVPMVEAVKAHPAIIAWEIFNEPEGMSNEFGWSGIDHVSMLTIERFINLCSAAIHRTDTTALVTNGAWSFYSLTDSPPLPGKKETAVLLSAADKKKIGEIVKRRYGFSAAPEEIFDEVERIAASPYQKNYYSDTNLIAAGGDSAGTLDFYSVHYYSTTNPSAPTAVSPFHHPAYYWNLTKPVVVGEFPMESGAGNPPGIAKEDMYDTLYQLEYAGAQAWSWTDIAFSQHQSMLAGMKSMWDNHRSDVDVDGISGIWPLVSITSPANNSTITDTTAITLTAVASDADGTIDSVEFFYADTNRIGAVTDSPFVCIWLNVPSGTYDLTAVATDNSGNRKTSSKVNVNIGPIQYIKFEAENATRSGPGMTVGTDANASNGSYVDIGNGCDSTSKITWTINNFNVAGEYTIRFGFRLRYDYPKYQFLNVNGARIGNIQFIGTSTTLWYVKDTAVNLEHGNNQIQLQMEWGWMYLDYLAVPKAVIVVSADDPALVPFSNDLRQNYPNPFNPETKIGYSLMRSGKVKLTVYDVLGRKVAVLVDKVQEAGSYEVPFSGAALTSGVYFYRLSAGDYQQTKKMLILK